MSADAVDGSESAERLSALADGELDEAATKAACAAWRNDPQARCAWHAYHLIGDVLRSDDLAGTDRKDEQFLVSLRARLAVEPVVLAPAPLLARRAPARGGRWMLPSAVAAGFLLVAGTFTVLRTGGLPAAKAPSAEIALAAAGAGSSLQTVSVTEPVEPAVMITDGRVIRDARLDRYLAAHKQFSGSSALGLPSAFLRSATVESDAR